MNSAYLALCYRHDSNVLSEELCVCTCVLFSVCLWMSGNYCSSIFVVITDAVGQVISAWWWIKFYWRTCFA